MRPARIILASSALLIAACSSGGDDAAPASSTIQVPSTAPSTASSTDPSTAPSSGAVESNETPPPTESVEETDPEALPEPLDEGTGVPDTVDDDAATDEPFVIDGPADVRPSCASLTRGVTDFTLDAGGAVHDVRIYVPTDISSDPAPVVLNWHGLGSNGAEQAAFTGYETLAEEEGFIVVHPTGIALGDDGRNSWELSQLDSPERDDLAFADALIDTVTDDWCADPTRVYSTGMSNGGFFTSELVCNRSDRIAAAASIAGTSHAESCAPQRSVPYISFHGTADDVVPYEGGDSTLEDDADADSSTFFDQVMPIEFGEFAADAGCDPAPTKVDETAEVIRYDYTGCDDDVPMSFYEIVGGGHTWPSSPLSDALVDFGFFTQDIDATRDAWAFMSQFTL